VVVPAEEREKPEDFKTTILQGVMNYVIEIYIYIKVNYIHWFEALRAIMQKISE